MTPKLQLVSIALVAAVFAGLYFFNRQVVIREIIREVPHDVVREMTVTKEVKVPVEVIKEVPVEKIVQVDKPIPLAYKQAFNFAQAVGKAISLTPNSALRGLSSVKVSVDLNPAITPYITVDEVTTKIELTLRQSGISVKTESPFWLYFTVDALKPDDPGQQYLIVFSSQTSLGESGYLFERERGIYQSIVYTYTHGFFGYAGTKKIHEAILSDAQSEAERFANNWLAANPKQ